MLTTRTAPSKVAAKAADTDALEAELKQLTNEELRDRFFRSFHGMKHLLVECAHIVKILDDRKQDVSGFPIPGTLKKIAEGQVDASLVWVFLECPFLDKVEALPLSDQRKLAADPFVEVAEPRPGGGFDKRKMYLPKAPADVGRRVVGRDGVRSFEEQQAYLSQNKARKAMRAIEEEEAPARETFAHFRQVGFTPSEWKAIRLHAANAGTTEAEIIRRFLVKAGAFEIPKIAPAVATRKSALQRMAR